MSLHAEQLQSVSSQFCYRLRTEAQLLSKLAIGAPQLRVSASHYRAGFVDRLHRFFVSVRQYPEGRRPQGLLQLLQTNVQRAALLMAVHDKPHRFVSIAGASQRAQIELCVADRRKFFGENNENRFGKFQAAQQQAVQSTRAVHDDGIETLNEEAADLAQMFFSDQPCSF